MMAWTLVLMVQVPCSSPMGEKTSNVLGSDPHAPICIVGASPVHTVVTGAVRLMGW